MISNVYHFIFGLSENFNEKPFCYFHYLNLKSCYLTQNKPTIYVHCIYEPFNNIWWEKSKEFLKVVCYKSLPDIVYYCNNKKVWRIEHQSDIFRLLLLKEHGGVYADIDTFFYRSFFPYFENSSFIIGIETVEDSQSNISTVNGLCNALIITDKNSSFLDIWMDSYKQEYDDYDWNKMSVRKPYELSNQHPSLIQIEPVESFHKYDWQTTFYEDSKSHMNDLGIYSKHMAESKVYDILKLITNDKLKIQDGLFANMCRNINGLLE
jgi:hypothetical protein